MYNYAIWFHNGEQDSLLSASASLANCILSWEYTRIACFDLWDWTKKPGIHVVTGLGKLPSINYYLFVMFLNVMLLYKFIKFLNQH